MELYNTLTRRKELLRPAEGSAVGIYVCGPTVYDHLHIGNLRPIIVFDTLRRYMETFLGWRVVYVQNVTDVDDKLIQRSAETGEPVSAIAETYTRAYFDLLGRLGATVPTHSPLATEHIPQMVEMIVRLVERGVAYERDGDVYYRVDAFQGYGKLSGRRLEEMEAGARIETSKVKENPFDFTLWKAARPGEPKWPSPWGEGRPGWHTECVVLSRAYLGDALDIHAGGNDLIFPHHENEIAQAEAAYDEPFFRFWLHNGMLNFSGEKMSKSLGNFAYAHEVLDSFDPEVVRYFYLAHHYRKPLNYSEEGLAEAGRALARLQGTIDDVEAELGNAPGGNVGAAGRAFLDELPTLRERYVAAMNDDLNTVDAMAAIQDLASQVNRFRKDAVGEDRIALREAVALIRELGGPLGVFRERHGPLDEIQDELVRLLVDLRGELREKREYELADRIRDRLQELGITLKDTAQGTIST